MKTKLTIILLITIFIFSCNDGIKQKVTHKQVGDELRYTVITTWTDNLGDHTITENYLDQDSVSKIKQRQLETAKEMMKRNNEQSSIH